jgi:hypothetical protein
MGRWLIGTLITSVLITVGWFFLTEMLPQMVARRAARAPQQLLTVLPGDDRQVPLPIDVETQLNTAKMTHDRFLREAEELLLSSRGAGLFADSMLAEAAEKAGDAVKLRPGSFDGNMMCGEIAVKRALRAGTGEASGLLQQAAGHFAAAGEVKKGVVDPYVGRGWAHLERADRLAGDEAAAAYLDATAAFAEGFRVNPHNLFVLRGWGMAVDGLARTRGNRAPEVIAAEESYRLALAEHRSGDHELHEWYATIRESKEPVRMPIPAVRDRFQS